MSPAFALLLRRLQVPLLALAATHLVGTVGFYLLWRDEGGTLFDGLYMTFLTVSTIGLEVVHPLHTTGRALAMGVAAGGIGTFAYMFSVLLDHLTSDEVSRERRRHRMQRRIDELSGHFIVAGFGRVGRQAIEALEDAGAQVVVVDPREEVQAEVASRNAVVFLHGDATTDEVLTAAGIQRARGLVVTTDSDGTNLYVVLAARLLNPKLFIVSRAVDENSIPKLQRAGADRAISPYAIGGKRLAHLMLSPRAVEFFELTLQRGNQQLNIGEIPITAAAPSLGRSLEAVPVSQSGANVLAVLRAGNVLSPRGELTLAAGDHVLALGTNEQLEELERLLAGVRR